MSKLLQQTLPEKCVWSVRVKNDLICGSPKSIDSTEPDNWYQGITHFSDRVWRFNTDTGFTDVLADPKNDFNIILDVENPELAPDEDYIFFRNKTDQTLWALKLN